MHCLLRLGPMRQLQHIALRRKSHHLYLLHHHHHTNLVLLHQPLQRTPTPWQNPQRLKHRHQPRCTRCMASSSTSTSSQPRPMVLLVGWLGAQPRYLDKYVPQHMHKTCCCSMLSNWRDIDMCTITTCARKPHAITHPQVYTGMDGCA